VSTISRTQSIRITTGLRHMAVGAFWFSVMSVLVKLAGQRLPSMEIVFFRGLLTLAMSYAIVKRARIEPVLGTNRRLLLQRGSWARRRWRVSSSRSRTSRWPKRR
jgi:drug/metabolite transporter (DMT)-like permease